MAQFREPGQLGKLWVDGGYSGPEFAAALQELRPKLDVEVIKRSDDTSGFTVLPKRWVVEVAAGGGHSLALLNDGTVTALGDKAHGECAIPMGLTNVIQIPAGTWFSIALKSNGT